MQLEQFFDKTRCLDKARQAYYTNQGECNMDFIQNMHILELISL
jgi:hypothetical protein